MASVTQDFTTYAGDTCLVTFTVLNGAGVPVDISTASAIQWSAQRDLKSSPVLSKSLGSGIALVSGGTTGKFQVTLAPADTAPLTGYYLHVATVTDSLGNVTTVTLGRMQVGRAPIATYSGDPTSSDRDAVRFYLSDTDMAAPLMYDGEVDFLLAKYPSVLYAAAQGARNLAGKFSGQLTAKRVGDLALTYAEKAKNYTALAYSLENQADQAGAMLYSGGVSKADMAAVAANSDRVPQPFTRGQFDITPIAEQPAVPPDSLEDL